MRLRLILMAFVVSVSCGAAYTQAQDTPSFSGEFDVQKALTLLYGGSTWNDPALKSHRIFKDEDQAYIQAVFDAPYQEQGVEKHIVIATLAPYMDYGCHACRTLLGGAAFRKDGESWTIEAQSKILGSALGPGVDWGDTFELEYIGPDRYGVVYQVNDVHQGDEDKNVSVIFPLNGTLVAQDFPSEVINGPGPGACGPPEQYLRVSFGDWGDSSPNPDEKYFDLVVDMQWNVGKCRLIDTAGDTDAVFTGEVCHRINRYRFVNNKYKLLKTQLHGCAVWHAVVEPPGK